MMRHDETLFGVSYWSILICRKYLAKAPES